MPGPETFHVSAEAYDRFVGRYGSQLAAALIGFAGVEPGARALDVGCGPGALTGALADRLGAAQYMLSIRPRGSRIHAGSGTRTWR